jgi:hypothetical protein
LFVVGHIEGPKVWKAVTAIPSWKKEFQDDDDDDDDVDYDMV